MYDPTHYIVSEFETVLSHRFPYECEPRMLKYVRRYQSPDGKRTWYYWPKRRYNSPEEAVDALTKWCKEHAPVTGTDNTVAGVPFSNDRTFGYIAGQHNAILTPHSRATVSSESNAILTRHSKVTLNTPPPYEAMP